MALISGSTIIRSLSLFHITLAFFFLTSPRTVSEQTLVFVLGEAMHLPKVKSFDYTSAPLAFLAAVLFVQGISDLVSISQAPHISIEHFAAQAPVRLVLFFCMAVYSFSYSSRAPTYKPGSHYGWGEGFNNRVIFAWAFIEMLSWFWVWTTLRDERRELALREQARRIKEEEERLR